MNIGVARGEIQIETGQAIGALNQFGSALQQANQTGVQSMQQYGQQIQQQGLALQQTGRVAIGLGSALAAPFVLATKGAIGFESQMAGVNAVMDLQGDQFEDLSSLAQQLGADTIFSGTEAAQGIETLGKAGIEAEQILSGAAKASTDLAAAAETDVASAADTIAAGIQAFGLAGSESQKVADVVAGAANASLASAQDLALGLGNVGSTAAAANMDLYETGTILSILTDRGQSGTDAATTLRTAISHLIAPIGQTAKEMNALGISFIDAEGQFIGMENVGRLLVDTFDAMGLSQAEQLESVKRLAGQDGMRALLGVMDAVRKEGDQGAKGWDDYEASVSEAGAAQRIAEERMDSTAGSIERLMGSLATLGERMGEPLLGVIRPVVDALDLIVDAAARLPAPVLGAVAALGSLTAGLTVVGGIALFAAGHIVEAIGRLTAIGFTFSDLGASIARFIPIVAAVGAAVTAIVLAWQNDFLGVRTAIEGVIDSIQRGFEHGQNIANFLQFDGIAADLMGIAGALDALGLNDIADIFERGSKAANLFFDNYEKRIAELKKDNTISDSDAPFGGDPARLGDEWEKPITTLDNLTAVLDSAAEASDYLFGETSDLSKLLRTSSKAINAFADEWTAWTDAGNTGLESLLAASQALATEVGWAGLADNIGKINTAVGEFTHGVQEAIANGANPMAAVVGALGVQIQNLTGIPIAEWALDMSKSIQAGADAYDILVAGGINPASAALSAFGVAIADITGDKSWIERFNTAAEAITNFGNSFQAAIDSGFNPFHAAAIGLASSLDILFGEDNPISEWIINGADAIANGANRIASFADTLTNTFGELTASGIDPLTAAVIAFGTAWQGGRVFEMPDAVQGILEFTGTLGSLKDALIAQDWGSAAAEIESAINQITGAIQSINIPEIVVNIGGWVLGTIGQTLEEFITGLFGSGGGPAGGADANGIGTNREGGGAVGAGITLNGILVNIKDWAQGVIDDIGIAIDKWVAPLIVSARDNAAQTIEAIKVTVSGWSVELAGGAQDLMTAIKEWAMGQGGGRAGYSNESGGGSAGFGGALVELGKVGASIGSWIIEGGQTLVSDIEPHARKLIDGMAAVPFDDIRATVRSWSIDSAESLSSAISDFVQNEGSGGSGAWEAHGANGGVGNGGGIPIPSVPLTIGEFVIETTMTAASLVQSIATFVTEFLGGIEFSEENLAGAESLGLEIGDAVGDLIVSELETAIGPGLETKAYDAGKNHPGIPAMVNSFMKGLADGFGEDLNNITGWGIDTTGINDGEGVTFNRNPDGLIPRKTEQILSDNFGEETSALGRAVMETGIVEFEAGVNEIAPSARMDAVKMPEVVGQPDRFRVDLSGSGIDPMTPPEGVIVGVPVTISPEGIMLANGDASSPIPLNDPVYMEVKDAQAAGQLIIHPTTGAVVDPAGVPILMHPDFQAEGLPIGQEVTLSANRGIFLDAAGNQLQVNPATQAMWDSMWAGESGGSGLFGEAGQPLMYRMPDGTEVEVQIPEGAFLPIQDQMDNGIAKAAADAETPNAIREIENKTGEILKNGMSVPRVTELANTGTGTGIGAALDGFLAGQISEAEFLEVTAQLGTKMGQVIQEAFTGFTDASTDSTGQQAAGGGIGQSLMSGLVSSIVSAPTEGLSAALKTKISEALTLGLSGSANQSGDAAGSAAGGIGASVVTSLSAQITAANFAAVGTALQAKIGEALSLGMSGNSMGGPGERGEAGTGMGSSVVQSLVSSLEGADFGAIAEAISTKLGESLQGVSGEGLGTALQGIFDTLAADAAALAANLEPVGAAIVQGIASGTGAATSVLQSALSAVITTAVTSASALASSSTPPVGSSFVEGAASGTGSATGVFQSAVDAVISAVVAGGVATASSLAPQIGTTVGETAGTGIGEATGTFQSAIDAMVLAGIDSGIAAAAGASAIGEALSTGAASGVILTAMNSAVATMVANGIQAGMDAAAASSPSKKMMELGGWMSEGAAIGVEEKSSMLSSAVRDMVDEAIGQVDGLSEIKGRVDENTRDINESVQGITQIATILENAPGWNQFGDVLRQSAEGIKDSNQAIREDIKDLVNSVKEQLADMVEEFRRAGEQAGAGINEGIASGSSGAGGGVGASIEESINKELANIDVADFVIGRDMFKTAKEGIGDLRGVTAEIKSIEQVAAILDRAPGWNGFGDVLREAAGNIETDVGGARDKFRDIMVSMNEITRTQNQRITEAIKNLSTSIASSLSELGSSIGDSISQGMSAGEEAAKSGGEGTASGYIGAIESTIENLKGNLQNVGIGSGQTLGGGMEQGMQNASPGVQEGASQLGTDAGTALQESVSGTAPLTTEAGAALGNSFTNGIAGSLPTAQQLGAQISTAVLESLRATSIGDSEAVRLIGENFGTAFSSGVASGVPEATQAGVALTDAAETGVNQGIPTAENTAGNAGEDIGTSLTTGMNQACKPVQTAARDLSAECAPTGMEAGEKSGVNQAENVGEHIGGGLASGLDQSQNDVTSSGRSLGTASIDSITSAVNSKINSMKTAVSDVVDEAETVTPASSPVGVEFINGLIDGLENQSGALYTKIRQIIDQGIQEGEEEAGVASPSKRMMEVGQFMGEGLKLGLEQQEDPVVKSMRNLMSGVLDAANTGEIHMGKLAFTSVGDRLRWTAGQIDSMLEKSSDRRMKAIDAYTGNRTGRDLMEARREPSQPSIQIGDLVIGPGDPGYNEGRGFIDAISRNHNSFYGSRKRAS